MESCKSCRPGDDPVRVLIIDLSNFGRFPSLSIGYLVAALRDSGTVVSVLTPLAHGVATIDREHIENGFDRARRRAYLSTHPALQAVQSAGRNMYVHARERPRRSILKAAAAAMDGRPDVILVSAHLDHYSSVTKLAELAGSRGLPLLVGGPAFSYPDTIRDWVTVPGVTALVAGESEATITAIVHAAAHGAGLDHLPGVSTPDGPIAVAPPVADLSALPVPDFSDFPWDRYPKRILPVMTGRGCEWSRCLFCSDITSVSGRTFRSRHPDAVFGEIESGLSRYNASDVIFLDIKLNSDLGMWRSLIERFQVHSPGAEWIGTVHVGRGENGLSRDELEAAYASGMRRTSFGLESGSQSLNDSMAKGTNVDDMSRFIHDAYDAGISVRATMISGYPGEQAKDIDLSVRFLRAHREKIDRIRISKFKPIPGTRLQRRYDSKPGLYPGIDWIRWDHKRGRGSYRYMPERSAHYRKSLAELLQIIGDINRRPVRDSAVQFDGLM